MKTNNQNQTDNAEKRVLRHNAWHAALAALSLTLSLNGVSAAQKTWSGGGTDNNWGSGGNWVGAAVPVNGDNLLFTSGFQRSTNFNNLTGLSLTGISFGASGFLFGGNMITNSGGVLDNNGNNTNNLVMNLTASQGFTNNAAATALVFGGAITNLGNTISLWGAGNIYLNGAVGGAAGASLTSGGIDMEGSGTLRLAAANTYAGGILINGGTAQLGNASGIPSGAGKGDVTNNAILDLNGNSPTINGLFGSGTVDNVAGAASLTLTVGNNATNTSGVFFFNGTIQNTSGKIGITKVNTNIFFLGGSPTYAGATIISAGEIALTNSASLPNSSAFTVSPGALFDLSQGSFSLAASQTLTAGRSTNGGPADIIGDPQNGGTMNIYTAGLPGTLRINGGLTLNGGSLVNYDLGSHTTAGAGSNDLIAVNGQLNLNGGTILLNPVAGTFANGTYTLITNQTTLVSGSAANLTVETPRGIVATLDSTTFPGNLLVGITGSSAPISDIWFGNNNGGAWDVNTTANVTTNGVATVFFNLDNIVFDDTASNTTVNVAAGVSPSSMLINNSLSNYVFSGVGTIAGAGGLTKSGTATATFRNANAYLGNTIINGGSIIVDYLNSGSIASQILYNGVTAGGLILNGGTFQENGRGNFTSYQLFNSTTFNPGASIVTQNTRISGGAPAIYLGSITRNAGGTVDFGPNVGSGSSQTVNTVGIFASTTNNNATASGIVGGYATDAAGEFARLNTSAGAQGGLHIYGGATYVNLFANNTNTDMTASLVAAANTNTMSVRFNTAAATTLTLTGTNVITSGGILMTATVGANQSTITGGQALTSGNGQDLILHQYDLTGNLVINSVIADNGTSLALTKTGGGTVILTGTNTYSGPTYINAGTVQVGNNGTVGSIATSPGVTNRGTLAFKHTDAVTFATPISGSGGLSQLGSGSLTLTANNSYSGVTTISAGTLQVGNGSAAGSLGTSASVTDNGSLIFSRPDNISYSGPISGSGSLIQQGAGSLTLNGTNTYTAATFINSGKIVLGSSASISNSVAFVLAGGTTLDASSQSSLALSGGTVNQILAGTGTFNGSVTTASGTGSGTRITPGTNGVYGTLTINNALNLNGGTINFDVSSGSRDLIVVGGNLTLTSGTLLLNVSGTLPNGSYKVIQYGGSLSGSAANIVVNGFSQSGSVATLSSATAGEIDLVISTYTPVNLTWQGDGGNNYWDVLTSLNWTNPAGTLVTYHQNDNVTFNDSSANTTVNLQTVLTPNQVTVNGTINSYTLQGSGSIGGGSLTVNNPNTLTILTQNGYSGLTTVNAGTVALGNGSTAGSFGSGAVTNNGALVFNEPANQTVGNAISGPGSLTHTDGNTLSLIGNNTMTGPVTISAGVLQVGVGGGSGTLGSGGVTNNSTLEITRSGSVTVGGAITGNGTVIVDGAGTVNLSGANSYINNTYISNGIVKLGNASAIPSGGATTGWLILDGGNTTAGTLDMNGFDQTVNALSGLAATVVGQIVNNGGSGTNTLTVNEIASTTFAGDILDNNGSGGKVALVMNGANTLTLQPGGTGSSYSGGTLIQNGIVSGGSSTTANNTMCGTGPVTFGTNGTLQLGGWTGSTTPDYGTFPNPLVIPTNVIATVLGSCRAGGGLNPSSVTGATNSTMIYVTRYVRGNVGGNWNGFYGVFMASNNAVSAGNDFRLNTGTGFPNARMILAPGAYMYNVFAGTPNILIGELTGDSSTTIALNAAGGGSVARFIVGGLNTTAEFDGSITDTHNIIKVGTGTWTLGSTALTFSGPTTVSNGVLALTASATLPNSTPITIAAPGILDVSAAGSLTLAAQTLQGNGTLKGSVATGSGTTVSPGGANAIGTLTITNDLNLAGTTVMELNRTNSPATNDMLVATTIEAGGTLQVNNIGSDLHTGDTFKLFSVPVTGAFAVTNLPVTTGNGSITYVWTNRLAIDGTIQVLLGVSNLNTTPTNITATVSGNVVNLAWPADHTGWYLQIQTNSLSTGLNNNWVTLPGSQLVNSTNMSINPANGSVFYRMSLNP